MSTILEYPRRPAEAVTELVDGTSLPTIDWTPRSSAPGRSLFQQDPMIPDDTLLDDWVQYARTQVEGADAFIAGAMIPMVGAMLGRRVGFPWGDSRQYPNVFALLAGKPGDRKSSTIMLAKRLADQVLPANAYLPESFSPESLFDEYDEAQGGRPDKLWVADDANTVLSDWSKSSNGERVATRFLKLYDSCALSESFRRNKDAQTETARRQIPETSTSVVFGITFNRAAFQGQAVRAGMARRFLSYIADSHGRTIVRPPRADTEGLRLLAEKFRRLTTLAGEMDFTAEADELWRDHQTENRELQAATDPLDEAALSRLSSAPMQALHLAMIFEACRWARTGGKFAGKITLDSLKFAIAHVRECLRAASWLDTIANRAQIESDAEMLLAAVRVDFRDRVDRGSIYLTRSELTHRFCRNPNRAGAWRPDDLYLKFLPALERKGLARMVRRRSDGPEIYAFRAETEE